MRRKISLLCVILMLVTVFAPIAPVSAATVSDGNVDTREFALRTALKASFNADDTAAGKEATRALITAALKGEDITAALAAVQAVSKPAPAENSFAPRAAARVLARSAAAPIDITEEFTDENFLTAVRELIEKDSGSIYDTDVSTITELDIEELGIESLDGIEYFTALKYLSASYNNLNAIDLSENIALEEILLYDNNLSTLDVSANTSLLALDCGENNLPDLDVSANTSLEMLFCDHNNLSELNVSKNTALISLSCSGNNLLNLNLSENTLLQDLQCSNSGLTELDLSANTELSFIALDDNKLTELDLSAQSWLIFLVINSNDLTQLKLPAGNALSWLECNHNSLTELDVSAYTALQFISCSYNLLETLDVSENSALIELECENNLFRSEASIIGLASGATLNFTPQNPLAPLPPENVTAEAAYKSAVVSFTPSSEPGGDGNGIISSYTVTASPGGITVAGIGSPITVSGLTGGVPYTFTVTATNEAGESAASEPSEAIIPGGAIDPSEVIADVKTEAELKAALKSATVTYIRLNADITLKKNDATYTVSPSKPRLTIDGIGSDGVRHILKENKDNSSGTSAIGVRSAKAKLS
ncbi:MAG: hypothetical protein LBL49_00930, partial [Clostridiales Family XIII bacterium]|nr:hypothetical protein [Clostridiales Family XIII bacterium]